MIDPYHQWLGIPPQEQPPNHYRLLGLRLFEDDPEVIRQATARQLARLQPYQTGPLAELGRQIAAEVFAAQGCLAVPDRRLPYDAMLRRQLGQPSTDAACTPPPTEQEGFDPAAVIAEAPSSRVREGRGARRRGIPPVAWISAALVVALVVAVGVYVAVPPRPVRPEQPVAEAPTVPTDSPAPKTSKPKPSSKDAAPADDDFPAGQWTELNDWIDLVRDSLAGRWKPSADGLTVAAGPSARLMLPVSSDGAYELITDVTRQSGNQSVEIYLPIGNRACRVVLADQGPSGLERVQGRGVADGPASRSESRLRDGQKAQVLAIVHPGPQATVTVAVDKRLLFRWSGDPASLSLPPASAVAPGRLAVGATEGEVTFHAIRFRRLSGKAALVAPTHAAPEGALASGGSAAAVRKRPRAVVIQPIEIAEAESPASVPTSTPRPAGAAAVESSDSSASEGLNKKLPIPSEADQQARLKLAQEVFRPEYDKATGSAEKRALARKILDQAIQTQDHPTDAYVLLRLGRDIALLATDGLTAFAAIEEMASRFAVNPVEMKADVLARLLKAARQTADLRAIADQSLALIDEAAARDEFALATRLGETATAAAGRLRDRELTQKIRTRLAALEKESEAGAQIAAAKATLEKSPTDPEANLLIGRRLAFVKRDWEQGVPMLALGSHEGLRALAQKELAGPQSAAAQLALADGWWDAAESLEGVEKQQARIRGGHWYRLALPELTGLTQAKAEKRLGELDSANLSEPAAAVGGVKHAAGSIQPGPGGQIEFTPEQAKIHGETLRVADGTLGSWTAHTDWVSWEFYAAPGTAYRLILEYACRANSAGSACTVAVTNSAGRRVAGNTLPILPTGQTWQDFRTVTVGGVILDREGPYTLLIKPTRKPGEAVMVLRAVRLVPGAARGR